jgi:hypothetical protein
VSGAGDGEDPGVRPIVPVRGARRPRRAAADPVFDLWLQRQLQALYGGIALEPLSPELLALIARDLRDDEGL